MKKDAKVLICPLNWGLGHATRCIPLILQLQKQGCRLTIGASGRPLVLLHDRFPDIDLIDFPDYNIACPRDNSLIFRLILRAPDLLLRIRRERMRLKKILYEKDFDTVISDNRYGLWNKSVHSIFITHQLMLKAPRGFGFAEKWIHRIMMRRLQHFDEIWIPDIEGPGNLSGLLSHRFPVPPWVRFTGWMSRFSTRSILTSPAGNKHYNLTAVISGPEPQRSFFEKILKRQMNDSGLNCCIIRGCPETDADNEHFDRIDLINHPKDDELADILERSENIICRPGYSTLMDLICLGKKAILVPTPGQTEQVYLGQRMKEKKWFYSVDQKALDLSEAILQSKHYEGYPGPINPSDLFRIP